jgi:hypothetical protein
MKVRNNGAHPPQPNLPGRALHEIGGLELKAQQIPQQVLVNDHIDRIPAAN